MSDAIVIKTRKFKRNPLLSRRQVRLGFRLVYLMRRRWVGYGLIGAHDLMNATKMLIERDVEFAAGGAVVSNANGSSDIWCV